MKIKRQAEIVKNLSSKELLLSVYLTQGIILIIGIVISLFLMDFSSVLSLFDWEAKWVIVAIVSGVIIVGLDILSMKYLPSKYWDDGGINKKLFSELSSWKIIILVFVVAVVEEWLFRGVIQSQFGLIPATIIFAFSHIRYWRQWYLILTVLLLSFWIGILFEISEHSLITVIILHFIIDLLLGLYLRRNRGHI